VLEEIGYCGYAKPSKAIGHRGTCATQAGDGLMQFVQEHL